MSLIDWSDEYSVNISEIDIQHLNLIEMINDLHDAMLAGKGKDAVEIILADLRKYVIYHFAYEEMLFNDYAYPDYEEHRKRHYDLINELEGVADNFFAAKNAKSILDVMNFLQDWLVNHILREDKKYSQFFNSKGIE